MCSHGAKWAEQGFGATLRSKAVYMVKKKDQFRIDEIVLDFVGKSSIYLNKN